MVGKPSVPLTRKPKPHKCGSGCSCKGKGKR